MRQLIVRKSNIFFVMAIMAGSIWLVGCGQAGKGDDDPARALIESKCVQCHSLKQAYKKRSSGEWPVVVDRMVSHGADLSAEEKAQIVAYLQAHYSK